MMTKLTYQNELPSAAQFQKALAEAMNSCNPVDDLLSLSNELRAFEILYQLSSADFYEQYQAGTLDDTLQHCIEWVTTYRLFLKTKRSLEVTLMRVAVQPEIVESV